MAEFNDNQFFLYPPFKHPPMWSPDADHAIPVVSPVGMGPKGDKGDPAYFDDLTPTQLQQIYQAASFVGNRSLDETVVTSGASTTVIPIPWVDYDQFDMLFVDVNGLDLAEGDDYTISSNNIVLATPLPAGQNVHFRLLRYDVVDGSKNIVNTMGRKDYNTVAEMKADMDLEAGDICHTLGFHAAGDGGAAWYRIRAHGVANGTDILALDNGCFALMQPEEQSVRPEQLGVFTYTVNDWAGPNQAYSKRTVVRNGSSCYTARQDVPTSIQIDNDEYWVVWNDLGSIGDFDSPIEQIIDKDTNSNSVYLLYKVKRNKVAPHFKLKSEDYSTLEVFDYAKTLNKGLLINCALDGVAVKNGVSKKASADIDDYYFAEFGFKQDGTLMVTIDATRSKTSTDLINLGYYNAFSIWFPVIQNGTAFDLSTIDDGTDRFSNLAYKKHTRMLFGWDDEYYYILAVEGRLYITEGATIAECAALGQSLGILNLVNFDGGGSTQIWTCGKSPLNFIFPNDEEDDTYQESRRVHSLLFLEVKND